jgi:hypothetical protein
MELILIGKPAHEILSMLWNPSVHYVHSSLMNPAPSPPAHPISLRFMFHIIFIYFPRVFLRAVCGFLRFTISSLAHLQG